MKKLIIIAVIVLGLSGCATYQSPSYSPDEDNISGLKNTNGQLSVTAEIPDFDDDGSITCRGAGWVTSGGEETFTDYIRGALEEELEVSGLFDEKGIPIKMKLERVDFSTTMGATNWYIDAVYSIGEEKAEVSTVYNDRSSYMGNVACNNMARYLPKAVSDHLSQLYRSSAFREVIQ